MITEITKIPKEGVRGIKKVLVYFNGTFPKKAYPIKDTTLPTRLFPDATHFFIRCKNNQDNRKYFSKYFPLRNKNNEKIHACFVNEDFENWGYATEQTDAAYCPWCGFDGYQKDLGDFKMKYHRFMAYYRKPIYMFINEPSCSSIKSFLKYLEDDETRKQKYAATLIKLRNLNDEGIIYQNVNFMPNDTPFSAEKPWWQSKVDPIATYHNIKVTPIPDNIIYDLPEYIPTLNRWVHKDYLKKRGIWLGTCFDTRVKRFNEVFQTPGLLDMDILGRGTEDVNLYSKKEGDTNVANEDLPKIFAEHEYSIYISRGKFTNMLGATFYEPLLNGLPQFIDEICDPQHEIFPMIPECYYSTEHELKERIEKYNIQSIWQQQVEHVLA